MVTIGFHLNNRGRLNLSREDDAHRGWVYALCDVNGDVLYVGQTRVQLRKRLRSHRSGRSPVLKRCKDIGRYVDRVDAFKVSIKDLDRVEAAMIRDLRPPANRAGL